MPKFITSCLFLSLLLPFSAFAQDCKRLPAWVAQIGYNTNRSAFSTSEQGVTGIAFIEIAQTATTTTNNAIKNPPKNKVYQHPSWQNAGNMGAIAITETGSVFATPTPKINLLGNRPDEQNILWCIDARTQEMKPAANLPRARPLSIQNPYGLMGLVYDCDTRLLYATSLAGSDQKHEVGRVFCLQTAQNGSISIVDTLPNIDAIGVGVWKNGGEKRVLYGATRNSTIFSIAINAATGKFEGQPRAELSLEGLGARGDDRAKKIRINEKGEMLVKGISFFYNLSNPPQGLTETEYTFRFVPQRGWQLVAMQ